MIEPSVLVICIFFVVIGMVLLALAIVPGDMPSREPDFPCIRCGCCSYVAASGEFSRTCEACMSGIDGEPLTCYEARGTVKCRKNARRR